MTAPRQMSDAIPNVDRVVSRKGSMFSGKARSGRRRMTLIGSLLAIVSLPALLAGVAGPANEPAGARPVVPEDQVVGAADLTPQSVAPVAETERISPFARTADGLTLSLPSDQVLLTGFHEASFDHSVALTPVGRCQANENPTEATCPPDVAGGPEYVILSSRGRTTTGTTAVDLVIEDGDAVISPVSGQVVDVRPYSLYGKYPDHRVEIAPDGYPHLRVVLIHVRDVHIAPGMQVVAGETELAGGPNRFPFASHIDRYFPTDRWPHVHIEVKPS